eukprot:m.332043 g.332043  ORF g.332043 m.332043 type:complete len:355 (+) comp19775_c3_seq1:3653-4717(+)
MAKSASNDDRGRAFSVLSDEVAVCGSGGALKHGSPCVSVRLTLTSSIELSRRDPVFASPRNRYRLSTVPAPAYSARLMSTAPNFSNDCPPCDSFRTDTRHMQGLSSPESRVVILHGNVNVWFHVTVWLEMGTRFVSSLKSPLGSFALRKTIPVTYGTDNSWHSSSVTENRSFCLGMAADRCRLPRWCALVLPGTPRCVSFTLLPCGVCNKKGARATTARQADTPGARQMQRHPRSLPSSACNPTTGRKEKQRGECVRCVCACVHACMRVCVLCALCCVCCGVVRWSAGRATTRILTLLLKRQSRPTSSVPTPFRSRTVPCFGFHRDVMTDVMVGKTKMKQCNTARLRGGYTSRD